MDADEFRKAAHAAIEEIISYNTSLPTLPVLPSIQPGYLRPLLPPAAPQTAQPWSEIQPDIASKIIPGLTHWQSPNFMAFFPAGVTYPSLLGEMYSAAFTAPAFNWLCSPACTELETVVLDWLAKAFNLPECFLSTSLNGGGGVIQGSASEAVVTCMVAARERYLHATCDKEGLPPLPSKEREERMAKLRPYLVALSSDQAHSSTQKGALIAGTRYRSISTSWSNELALTGEALAHTIAECEAEGLHPYFLTATLGTTNTCAVDDFPDLIAAKAICAPNLWIHVDAAYAGAALICPEFQHYSSQLSGVDSFDMNMHKWLLVNFDASCLYVRNRNDLTRALSITPSYLQNKHTDSGLVTDYRDWQIPLGRRFRSLKIWFVMRAYGIKGMQDHIRNTIRVGEVFKGLVEERRDTFEILAAPRFALTCFRIKPSLIEELRNAKSAADTNGHVAAPAPSTKTSSAAEDSTAPSDSAFVPSEPSPPTITTLSPTEAQTIANNLTKSIAEIINERGEIFITASSTQGKTFVRVVSANPNAEERFVKSAFGKILEVAGEVLDTWKA